MTPTSLLWRPALPDNITNGAYSLWAALVSGRITEPEALDKLLQFLAGLLDAEDLANV
jgi:hypothetical protein